jgi:heat shock protein HslJ
MGTRGGTAVITPTAEISLIFNTDGTLSGYDGCNNYFGSANLTGRTNPSGTGLTLGPVGSTKKYCSAVADQEQQYLNILGKTSAYAVNGTQLTLTASTRDALVYQRVGM